MINFELLADTPNATQPFPHFVAKGLINTENMQAISRDFPVIKSPGVFHLSDVTYGKAFADLIADINSTQMCEIFSDKLSINLKGKKLMISVRGQCQLKDGRIHNDSKDKIATGLLYLNETWSASGGRLRLLNNSENLQDMIAEVPPEAGSMIAFKRTENSWHGHEKFEGERRSIMFNWIDSDIRYFKNVARHKLSHLVKKLGIKTKSGY